MDPQKYFNPQEMIRRETGMSPQDTIAAIGKMCDKFKGHESPSTARYATKEEHEAALEEVKRLTALIEAGKITVD